jgi:hypothetical protein
MRLAYRRRICFETLSNFGVSDRAMKIKPVALKPAKYKLYQDLEKSSTRKLKFPVRSCEREVCARLSKELWMRSDWLKASKPFRIL